MSYYGRRTHTWRRLRAQVLATSDVCWLCGHAGADTVDHIVPLSLAPDLGESLGNLAPAHRACNSRRGAQLGTASGARNALKFSREW